MFKHKKKIELNYIDNDDRKKRRNPTHFHLEINFEVKV